MSREEQLISLVAALGGGDATAQKYAAHLGELIDVLNPTLIGGAYEQAIEAGDLAAALAACAAYYRGKPDFPVAELSSVGRYDATAADRASRGMMREVNIDHAFEGEIDFLFDPTAIRGPRNHEWLWQFNRHSYWTLMARAFRETGDEKYATAFRTQLLGWIAQTDIPQNWNGPGSAWRTIECGLRLLGSWQVAYDGFRTVLDDLSLLLMIASMHRQVVHLVAHPTGGNWLMMESNGVYTFSALFPELRDAAANRAVATERLLREMRKQILPDGMHNELSPDYQTVVYNCAINFYRLAGALGLADEVPQDFVELIHKTAHAAVLLSTPALTQPRTNDTYTMHTRLFTERTALLPGEHPEYRYVNSHRAEGQPPAGETASAYLPYAGFAVMRSDWGADATYLCFDVGPLGAGHMHQDKLNINLYRGSEELIFDDGGGQYESSPARAYAVSAYDHNTVLVDGMAQHRTSPLVVQEPIDAHWVSNATFDYAAAIYDDGYKRAGMSAPVRVAAHRREVRFCKPAFFCVRDTLTSLDGNAHEYELLFHLDTTRVNVLQDDTGAVLSDFGRTYELLIVPLDDEGEVSVSAVSGQTEPSLRGWYNGRNESKLHEAITVSRTVRGVRNFCFTSLLFPVRRGEPLPKVVRQGDEVVVALGRREYRLNLRALQE